MKLWALPVIVYVAFVWWYTDLGGPMTAAEIDDVIAQLETRGAPQAALARWRGFMESDTGNQFIMLNVIDMADSPPPMPNTAPNATAQEVMGVYMEHMYRELFRRACHPVFSGNAVYDALDLSGIAGAEHWELGALMRYRSRRDLMAIATLPATQERHDYKLAALEKTIAFPVEPQLYLSDARLLLFLLLFGVTAFVGYLRK